MAYGTAHLRRAALALAAAALAGCGTAGHSAAPNAAELAADLKGSPPALAALHAQAGSLLAGGVPAFTARLRALRGYPIVVTQWSSWCDGCEADLAYFRTLSASLGRRVAFVGVDVDADGTAGAARSLLRKVPVSFPSYRDADRRIAAAVSATWSRYTPVTFFYRPGDPTPESFAGPFLGVHSLRAAIRRYAGV